MAETKRRKPKAPKKLYVNCGLDREIHEILAEAAEEENRNLNQQGALWLKQRALAWRAERENTQHWLDAPLQEPIEDQDAIGLPNPVEG